jgi:hypothetical protein
MNREYDLVQKTIGRLLDPVTGWAIFTVSLYQNVMKGAKSQSFSQLLFFLCSHMLALSKNSSLAKKLTISINTIAMAQHVF